MFLYELEQQIHELVNQFIDDSDTIEIGYNGLRLFGLDSRCGRIKISISGNYVLSYSPNSIEYYGGWEYIHEEYKVETGICCFYDGEASRVSDVIETAKSMLEEGWVYDPDNRTFLRPEQQQEENIEEG